MKGKTARERHGREKRRASMGSLRRGPQLANRDGQHLDELATLLDEPLSLATPRWIARDQAKPVSGLARFAEGDRVLRRHVAPAVSDLSLFELRADGRNGFPHLLRHVRMRLALTGQPRMQGKGSFSQRKSASFQVLTLRSHATAFCDRRANRISSRFREVVSRVRSFCNVTGPRTFQILQSGLRPFLFFPSPLPCALCPLP
jgi:hypothetical protein